VIAPEILYVCVGGVFGVLDPLTVPVHPQRKIIGSSVAAKRRDSPATEFIRREPTNQPCLFLFTPMLIAQAPKTFTEHKNTHMSIPEKLIRSLD
jgi:hypothetical protein